MDEELKKLFRADQGLPDPPAEVDWLPAINVMLGQARAARAAGATSQEAMILVAGFWLYLLHGRSQNKDSTP